MRPWWDSWTDFPNSQRGRHWGSEKQAALGILNQYEDYKGLVSDIAFWSYAKSPDQISSGFGLAVSDGAPGLVGMFRFSEGSGTVASSSVEGDDRIVLFGDDSGQLWSGEEAPTENDGGGPSPPLASFQADPQSGPQPLTVAFRDMSTGSPDAWWWDFGDGDTSTEQNPNHTYTEVGKYSVVLIVDRAAISDRAEWPEAISVTAQDIPEPETPTVGISASTTEGEIPLVVDFEAESSDEIWEWSWDFGDGNTATGRSPSHTYETPGNFTVVLTVEGPGGVATVELAQGIAANSPQLTVDFSTSVVSGEAPLTVEFTDESVGFIDGWSWDFGDGGYSSAASPIHVYEVPGQYTVRLTVDGPYGSDTAIRTELITVSPSTAGLVAAYGFEETGGTEVLDSSPAANNGSLSGATRTGSGRFGRALDFDGAGDLVTVPRALSLNLREFFTLEAWVSPRTIPPAWQTVLSREGSGSNDAFLASSTPFRRPAAGAIVTTEAYVTGSAPLPTNAWTHLASTFDGERLRLYVDGIEVASRALSGILSSEAGPLSIGGNTIWGEFFSGVIDEVRVHDRPLSPSEIRRDMAQPVDPS